MGKVIKIPHCDWLPEGARPSDTGHCNNISPKSKWAWCAKFFFSLNIFCDSKKIFSDFSIGPLGWN